VVFDRLLDSGERFRKAQASQLAGKSADFRAPLETRRTALSELSGQAAGLLTGAGYSPTPDTIRRVTTTLEALSTYAGLPDTPQPGRLVDDVQPPGFETLAALVPRVDTGDRAGGPTRVIPFQHKQPSRKATSKRSTGEDEQARAAERKARLAQARAAVQEAERGLRDARKTAQRAEEDLKKAAARAKETESAKQKIEQQMEKVTADADAARKTARTVAAQAEEAAQAVEDAERSLEKAKRELESLNPEP
jgi:delta 1-pyrroline-5-carboxylate dehydrogenase